jgi:DNA replication protein DnaC
MARLLILDDLGNEEPWQTVLFEVVQYRYRIQLPNIITTGLSGPELPRRYGDGITRRLVNRDGQLGTIVDCWEGREAI